MTERAKLAARTCAPCRGGVPPLPSEKTDELIRHLDGWAVEDQHHLSKAYSFADFGEALAFVNRVGRIAEDQGHHPDMHLSWGKVTVEIWTHKIDGLTESDFILAAKIDQGD